jgi:disulfide bond formation protein DsbB
VADSARRLDPNWTLLFSAWFIACTSTLGSLFFSYVMDFAPCVLCWYQRICMFPLVVILARGLFPFDRSVIKYALPLAGVGWLLAAYHNLLHAGWIPADMQPCAKGVSCTEEYIELFGLLSIPALALLSFTAQISILIVLKRRITE